MSYLIEHYSQSVRDCLQNLHDSIYHLFGGNEFYLNVYSNVILFMTVYWSIGALFTFVDLTRWPKFLYRYKIQDEKVTLAQLFPVIGVVLFNQMVVHTLFNIITYNLLQFDPRPYKPTMRIPTIYEFVRDWIVILICQEIAFYYTHRLAHSPTIYKSIHKKHHQWTAPIAIAAFYCHPLEQFFSNLPPGFIGVAIMRSHRFTVWTFTIYAVWETLISHSGYHLPFCFSPEFHDFHHAKFNNNYGVYGVLDWLHGTDKLFRRTIEFKRHKILTCLRPIKSLYPDYKTINDKKTNNNGKLKNQ